MENDQPLPRDALGPLDLARWIDTNAAAFRPPVANKVVFPAPSSLHGGTRTQRPQRFPCQPGDEIFYQLEGTIAVDILHDNGRIERRLVNDGDVMLVPAGVAHSPRLPPARGTIIRHRARTQVRRDRSDRVVLREMRARVRRASFGAFRHRDELTKIIRDFDAEPAPPMRAVWVGCSPVAVGIRARDADRGRC